MNRQYFYTENGITKRYAYCTMCGAGPFKENERGHEYIEKGQKHTPLNYCRKCATALNRLGDFEVSPESIESKPTEQIVVKLSIQDVENVVIKPVEFIVVRCKDGSLYSSVSGDVEKSIKNMNRGKGSDYTKPSSRRPVTLMLRQIVSSTEEGTVIKKKFDKMDLEQRENIAQLGEFSL